ncbi:MAG: sigma 54-interacting transcriptional regulator [Desulfovibrio sp.]|jgi:PAS domain S-box-containing protein|nr:sigma 54-interacting transcriptional regulator [Desulfovibrio sp.]
MTTERPHPVDAVANRRDTDVSKDYPASAFLMFSPRGQLIHTVPDLDIEEVLPAILESIAEFVKGHETLVHCARTEDGTLAMQRFQHKYFNGIVAAYHWKTTEDQHHCIAALKKKCTELEGIFETSRDGIVVADENGVYRRVNSSYERISGLKKDKVIGRSGAELVASDLISQSATEQVLSTGKPVTLDQIFLRSQRRSYITANPLYDSKGNIFRVVTNVRDTTELHNLRTRLSKTQERLNRYSQLVKTFTREKDGAIFRSAAMREIRNNALRFSKTDAPVLLVGNTGTGKEVLADFIHRKSPRAGEPFLKINCAAIPDHLLEAELFGYKGGAFTGANRRGKVGLFETANNGTLLLDEIGEMPLSLQAKLLRFVESREFYKIGDQGPSKVNVRLLAATNRSLDDLAQSRDFRTDLLYRLKVLCIDIPPLRERREDILPLMQRFLEKNNRRYGQNKAFHPDMFKHFLLWSWPGNVRELEHLVERLVIMSDDADIVPALLPPEMLRNSTGAPDSGAGPSPPSTEYEGMSYGEARDRFERSFWSRVRKRYPSFRQAAKALDVTHVTVLKKIKRYVEPGVADES